MSATTETTRTTKPTRGARGGYAKGRARRNDIIQSAIGLFGEVGFHGASLRDIAARSGVSHPGLLHHFATKTALLEAVLAYRDEADEADLDADVEQGRTWLEALVRLSQRNQLRRPIVELFAALSAEATSVDHPAHQYFVDRYLTSVAAARADLERYAEAGRLRPGVDIDVAARAIIALMDGLQIQWLMSLGRPKRAQVNMAADLSAYLDLIIEPA
ncbi:TetR family transcriptional regulator [Serinibacter arcticus]|uniref:TetR family transcriptional regulator n=1 Tax=Serinibacter arcticus TaxID=1655435 RepID=A0A2U1ZXM1_9MICO|nr:TetR/AcrR family transcriptional regulator [Serinibacter arcticus]PWD51672.1 TetR family transcriptional regulator [Serinibacter arcticus]